MPRTCVRIGMHADARPAGRVGIPAAAAGLSGTGLASREATPTGDALLSAAKSKTPADAKAAKPAKSGKAFLLIAVIAVVAVAAAGGAGWYFAQKKTPGHAAAEPAAAKIPAPAQYFPLDPAFVVNLNNASSGAQFLQVEIQLMTRDPAALEILKQQAPGIRAKLLMQLSQVNADSLTTLEGKEALRKQALASVKTMMTAETGKPIVEDLVFTSFVMQ